MLQLARAPPHQNAALANKTDRWTHHSHKCQNLTTKMLINSALPLLHTQMSSLNFVNLVSVNKIEMMSIWTIEAFKQMFTYIYS